MQVQTRNHKVSAHAGKDPRASTIPRGPVFSVFPHPRLKGSLRGVGPSSYRAVLICRTRGGNRNGTSR